MNWRPLQHKSANWTYYPGDKTWVYRTAEVSVFVRPEYVAVYIDGLRGFDLDLAGSAEEICKEIEEVFK